MDALCSTNVERRNWVFPKFADKSAKYPEVYSGKTYEWLTMIYSSST